MDEIVLEWSVPDGNYKLDEYSTALTDMTMKAQTLVGRALRVVDVERTPKGVRIRVEVADAAKG